MQTSKVNLRHLFFDDNGFYLSPKSAHEHVYEVTCWQSDTFPHRIYSYIGLCVMKSVSFFILIFFNLGSITAETQELKDIREFEWKQRTLIVWSEESQKEYETLYSNHRKEIEDRDMIIFVLGQSNLLTNFEGAIESNFLKALKSRFPQEFGRYFLVGKDGNTKISGDILNIKEIFDRIDQMPMRRFEMNSQNPTKEP